MLQLDREAEMMFPTNPINALEASLWVREEWNEVLEFPTNPINALEARKWQAWLEARLEGFQLIQLTHWKRALLRASGLEPNPVSN